MRLADSHRIPEAIPADLLKQIRASARRRGHLIWHDEDDLVQEASVAILNYLKSGKSVRNWPSFIKKVVFRKWVERIRRDNRGVVKLSVQFSEEVFGIAAKTEVSIEDRLDLPLLMAAARDLMGETLWAVFDAVVIRGTCHAEVAESLCCCEQTIGNRLKAAREIIAALREK